MACSPAPASPRSLPGLAQRFSHHRILRPTCCRAGRPGGWNTREQENEGKLQAFLREPVVRVVPVDEPASHGYAALKEHLRAAGQPIPENDIWIAALAVQHYATLVTSDAHFGHLPQVARSVE